jgi:hypothetical protein
MKSVFSIRKIFSFCFFVPYLLSSCQSYLVVNGNEYVPKKLVVNITGEDISNGHLKMIDNFGHSLDTFQAWPKQTIKWNIKVSGLHIESIVAKPGSKNGTDAIFKDPPRKEHFASNWTATIHDEADIAKGNKENGVTNYDYNIVWRMTDTIKHTFDPRIQIR